MPQCHNLANSSLNNVFFFFCFHFESLFCASMIKIFAFIFKILKKLGFLDHHVFDKTTLRVLPPYRPFVHFYLVHNHFIRQLKIINKSCSFVVHHYESSV